MRAARSLRHAVESAAFGALAFSLRLLPRRAVTALGRWTGSLIGLVDRKHRAVAARNLEQALGESLDRRERAAVLRQAWRQFGRTTFEGLILDRFGIEDVGRAITEEGREHVDAAFAEGKGVLFFSAHFGNWELMAYMAGLREVYIDLVARPLDNPLLERQLSRLRVATGNRIIPKKNAIRGVLRSLGENRGVAIMIDHNVRT
jgi:KDO2-lipid IV(A) lauroyltransferase